MVSVHRHKLRAARGIELRPAPLHVLALNRANPNGRILMLHHWNATLAADALWLLSLALLCSSSSLLLLLAVGFAFLFSL